MQKIRVEAGQNKTIYSHLNASGHVFFRISNKSNTNKAKLWWVKGPFGSIENLGEFKGTGKIKIKGVLWGKLRIGQLDSSTVVQVHDDPRVNTNFPSIEF